MAEFNDVISSRLNELFTGESDYMTASKLNMSPANKIRNGKQQPTAETLKNDK